MPLNKETNHPIESKYVFTELLKVRIKHKGWYVIKQRNQPSVMFWPFDPAKNAIQGDAPEGSDTF